LLIILLSLSAIVWIALALRQLNVVTAQGQDAWMLFKMTTLALPKLMAIIAPFSLLIAVIHTLNRLNSDSELIVLTASGATIWTVAKPLVLLGLIVSVGVGFVNHFAMPWSLRLLRQYIIEVRTDLLTQVIQPGRFSSPEPDLTFHIRERAFNGELKGMIVHDTRDKKQSQSYLADRGVIVKGEPSDYLVMSDGHIVRRAEGDEPAQIIAFDKYAIDLSRFEKKLTDDREFKPAEQNSWELWNPDAESYYFKKQPGKIRSELHERFASALYPIAFVLIALATVGQAQSTRQSRIRVMALAFCLAASIRLGGMALNNVVALSAEATPLLYALPLAAIAGALWAMDRTTRRLGQQSIFSRAIEPLARFAASLPRPNFGRFLGGMRGATGR